MTRQTYRTGTVTTPSPVEARGALSDSKIPQAAHRRAALPYLGGLGVAALLTTVSLPAVAQSPLLGTDSGVFVNEALLDGISQQGVPVLPYGAQGGYAGGAYPAQPGFSGGGYNTGGYNQGAYSQGGTVIIGGSGSTQQAGQYVTRPGTLLFPPPAFPRSRVTVIDSGTAAGRGTALSSRTTGSGGSLAGTATQTTSARIPPATNGGGSNAKAESRLLVPLPPDLARETPAATTTTTAVASRPAAPKAPAAKPVPLPPKEVAQARVPQPPQKTAPAPAAPAKPAPSQQAAVPAPPAPAAAPAPAPAAAPTPTPAPAPPPAPKIAAAAPPPPNLTPNAAPAASSAPQAAAVVAEAPKLEDTTAALTPPPPPPVVPSAGQAPTTAPQAPVVTSPATTSSAATSSAATPPAAPAPATATQAQASTSAAATQTASRGDTGAQVSEVQILFDSSEAGLSGPAKTALETVAQAMLEDDASEVQLFAYAGQTGIDATQARRLSLSRAMAVRAYLIGKGIRPARMQVRALGNKTTEGSPDRVDVVPAKR